MDSQLSEGLKLLLVQNRVDTFTQWPFSDGCLCTPEQMAKAGFIHCPGDNAPDVAQCFFCFKELEGWEPDDDPMEEHRKHSPSCVFLGLQKDVADFTMHELIKLQKERMKNLSKKLIMQKVKELEKYASRVHSEINRLHK
ncbi:PREDICTED: baculoviral IAP repeat-containing protein 5 [Gekko japonicus]|uniref:Baculoviral IAP repeat-containing protein 5 n=1 Tax=Gekko japonicus TaxID=146911 RepID=A0ABM1KFJ9_GEKJA|nr:PREDICTED: baculoviral IAP repeat-containing protein 5 [Gekko japonicus]